MASSKAPKHDFAPAWLNFPKQENMQKPPGSKPSEHGDKSSRGRREDYYNNYNGHYGLDYSYHPLQRQRSFEKGYYEDRRYPPPQKYRHHSVDDDYYNPAYAGYGYYNGYSYDKYGNHYRSQPTLYSRPPVGRDGKYHHPNARYSQPPMNGGGYPPYYDYPYEYYHGDPYYNNYSRPPASHKRPYHEKDHKGSPNKGDKDRESKTAEQPEKSSTENLEEEFPSLNGEGESTDGKPSKAANAGGVWASQSSNGVRSQTSLYKTLVPSKAVGNKKANKDSVKLTSPIATKDINSNSSFKSSALGSSREVSGQSPTPPIDIHNTRLITQPKNLSDKKSDFLKTLRNENGDSSVDDGPENLEAGDNKQMKGEESKGTGDHQVGEESLVNGMDSLTVDSHHVLSSSLEAEQRLLREMGWNEADDEGYEITEDDRREFQKLTKEMKQERNGFHRNLVKPWSPQHRPLFQTPVQDLNDTLSSTSDDSDSDMD